MLSLVAALNAAGAVLLGVLLWGQVPAVWIFAWGGAVLAVVLARLGVSAAYAAAEPRRRKSTADTWACLSTGLAGINGCVWGSGAILFFDAVAASNHMYVVLALAALATAGLVTGALLVGCAAAFLAPALLLPVGRMLWHGDPFHVMLGLFLAGGGVAVVVLARRSQDALIRTRAAAAADGGPDVASRLAEAPDGAFVRTLIENIPCLLLVTDDARRIVYASPSVPATLGVAEQDLRHTPLDSLLHPEDISGVVSKIGKLLAGGGRVIAATPRLRAGEGTWLSVLLHGRTLPGDADGTRYLLFTAAEASEYRRVQEGLRLAKERAEEVSRAKADFLATMSHEIRTPMGGMIGLIDLLKATGLTEKQQQYVHALDRAGEHLSDLLNDILDFSKIEANKLESEAVTFDLPKVVGGVLDIFRAQAQAKGVVLRSVVGPEVAPLWHGDLRHLRQVLANLVGNAVKFTDEGHVEVSVTRHGDCKDGRALIQVAVEDTGIGIDPDKLPHIFDPFAQADSDALRRHGGTGLGLTISRRLVEFMKGRIWAVSRQGLGSTFYVRIPLAPADAFHASSAPAVVRRIAPAPVLVVDDSDLNRLVLGDMLAGQGMMPDTAANGVEALRAFTERTYGLVFIDMQMPVMDGVAAVRALRGFEAETGRPRCPVVALSATALKEDRDAALEAGCDEFVIKPLRKDALIMLLKTYLPTVEGDPLPVARDGGTPAGKGQDSGVEPELAPLLPSFLEHLRQGVAELGVTLDSGDMAVAAKLVHQIKGNAMLFGQRPLAALLSELEEVCRAAAADDREAFIEQADHALVLFSKVEAEAGRTVRALAAARPEQRRNYPAQA